MKAKTYRKLVKQAQPPTTDPATATLAVPGPMLAALEPLAPEGASTVASQVITSIRRSLPALQAVAVVEAASGLTLSAYAGATSLHLETAAAYGAEVVKQKQKALAALNLTNERIEDILMTLSSQLHLIKLTADGSRFVYLVVSARDTSLAVAREVLRHGVAELG